jgi:hypothetical protein
MALLNASSGVGTVAWFRKTPSSLTVSSGIKLLSDTVNDLRS